MKRLWPTFFLLAALWGPACNSDEGSTVEPTGCRNPKDGVINANHGHDLASVCADDVGAAISLTLSGEHTHELMITELQVELIQNGTMVIVTSTSNEDHSHAVTFN